MDTFLSIKNRRKTNKDFFIQMFGILKVVDNIYKNEKKGEISSLDAI